MQANKVFLFQLVLVACLVGFVLSATTDTPTSDGTQTTKPDRYRNTCENCRNVAQYFKDAMPQAKYALKRLCDNYWFDHNRGNCEHAVERIADEIQRKSNTQLCQEIGLCRRNEFHNLV